MCGQQSSWTTGLWRADTTTVCPWDPWMGAVSCETRHPMWQCWGSAICCMRCPTNSVVMWPLFPSHTPPLLGSSHLSWRDWTRTHCQFDSGMVSLSHFCRFILAILMPYLTHNTWINPPAFPVVSLPLPYTLLFIYMLCSPFLYWAAVLSVSSTLLFFLLLLQLLCSYSTVHIYG